MTDLDLERLGAQAQILIEASAAPETEVSITSEVDNFVRFGDRGPTQCADRERVSVSIRARVQIPGGGYSEASVEVTGRDPQEWHRALGRAHELAKVSPVNERALPLGGEVQVPEVYGDGATMAHPASAKAEWVKAALSATEPEQQNPAGMAQTSGRGRVIVNSMGRAVQASCSSASFSLTATGLTGSGVGKSLCARVEDLDVERAIKRAVDKSRRAQKPRALAPGEYPVVLEPLAVCSALMQASYRGFGAREYEEGESFLCGRVGERAFAPELSITDNAMIPVAPGLPFDGEGNPRQITPLVQTGVLQSPVTDVRFAKSLGLPCSGHGASQPSADGPMAENLVVSSGECDLGELLRRIDRGLLITQFHYTNAIDFRELLLTGMTRNGTFWVEDGEIQYAVKNLRFTDSLVRAFAEVRGVGTSREVVGDLIEGVCVTPAIALPNFRFTSVTDA